MLADLAFLTVEVHDLPEHLHHICIPSQGALHACMQGALLPEAHALSTFFIHAIVHCLTCIVYIRCISPYDLPQPCACCRNA